MLNSMHKKLLNFYFKYLNDYEFYDFNYCLSVSNHCNYSKLVLIINNKFDTIDIFHDFDDDIFDIDYVIENESFYGLSYNEMKCKVLEYLKKLQ